MMRDEPGADAVAGLAQREGLQARGVPTTPVLSPGRFAPSARMFLMSAGRLPCGRTGALPPDAYHARLVVASTRLEVLDEQVHRDSR